ncbi:hypothetical protein MSMAT_0231 [Methanosarcina mazei TMA]|nr:hypothetical protein MSMAT_0231 [Methanosarcina mazei TMA]
MFFFFFCFFCFLCFLRTLTRKKDREKDREDVVFNQKINHVVFNQKLIKARKIIPEKENRKNRKETFPR